MGFYGNLVDNYTINFNIIESTIKECDIFNDIINESLDFNIVNESAMDNIKRIARNIVDKINKLLDKIKDFFKSRILDKVKQKVKEAKSKNTEKSISYDTFEYLDLIEKIMDIIDDDKKAKKIDNLNDFVNESDYKIHISSVDEAKDFIRKYENQNDLYNYLHELENTLKEKVKYWEDIIKDNENKIKNAANKGDELIYKFDNNRIKFDMLSISQLQSVASSLALSYIARASRDVITISNMISK